MKLCMLFVTLAFFLAGCKENYTPKPRAFYRIEPGKSSYNAFSNRNLSFSVSGDAVLQKKSSDENEEWFNIVYPLYNAEIYCTYLKINKSRLNSLIAENQKLVFSHTGQATEIQQLTYEDNVNQKYGVLYRIIGNVATPFQFYLTDNEQNFLRGSLYFRQEVQRDSILPVLEILEQDLSELFESLSWNKC